MNQTISVSSYLALKEIWRNRGRFLLVYLIEKSLRCATVRYIII